MLIIIAVFIGVIFQIPIAVIIVALQHLLTMSYTEIFILFLNILFCIPSIASLTKFDYWWVRGFDFPRVQISFLILGNIALALGVYHFDEFWHYLILLLLCLSLIYQIVKIFPYTIIAKKQVIKYGGKGNDGNVSILVSNVLMPNREYDKLLRLVRKRDPDVLLTLETDKRWEKALATLEEDYPHCVKVPLDNLYGMHLYSKLALKNIEVKYLVEDDIPSIHATLVLPNGKKTGLHCLHPRPPSPGESKTSTARDAELLLVGREIGKDAKSVLVCGDLNDVAWSRTTKIFQKISGLLDPRRGRGFFNTYSTKNHLMRWPLDHVFHSKDFSLIELAREEEIGSDHFPMFIHLNYTPRAQWEQNGLVADEAEEKWAEEKIEEAGVGNETLKNKS